jgi:hypothetical protein
MPLFVYRNNKTFKTIIDKTSLHDLKTNAKEGGLYQSTFYTKKKVEQKIYSITNSSLSELYKKDRQCACNRNTEARSRNHLSCGNEISIVIFESASVTLVIQLEKGMLVMMRVF